jgi:hypothetical protein
MALFCAAAQQEPATSLTAAATLDVTAFGARSGDGSDTTPAVRAALEECRRTKARRLVFPTGRYDFWPDRAAEKYLYISNNDEGLKRIAFPLLGIEDLEIDGQGAQFVFHGYISPIVLENARNITFKDFSIDWARTFHSEGRVLAVGEDSIDLEFPEQFPFKVDRGLLVFTGEGKDVYPFGNLLEFNPEKRETAFMARDYYTGPNLLASVIGPRRVRVSVPKITATPGNVLVFGAARRLHPAFTISDSAQIKLTGINLYHCGGMGVIAQRSSDIELDHVQVTPAPSSGRILSITADATHFVNCKGRIVMTDCLFENQMDDATNIHGTYAQVTRRLSSKEVEVKLFNLHQHGFDFILPGVRLEFVHSASLVTYHEAVVRSTTRLNKEFTRVVLDSPLPEELSPGDAVAGVSGYPDVVLRRCTIRGNRARGILLGSRGKILIEDNVFHTPGAAILLEGDARYWFEQAGVRDLVIRRNRFDNCNFGVWGESIIEVGSGIDESHRAESRYNRGILIEDNLFRMFDTGRIVRAYSVDDLSIRMNRVESTADYPPQNQNEEPFDIQFSSNVAIER